MNPLGWLALGGRGIRTMSTSAAWTTSTMPWMDRATVLATHTAAPARLAERLECRVDVPWNALTHGDTPGDAEPAGPSDRRTGHTIERGPSGLALDTSASEQVTSAPATPRQRSVGDDVRAAPPVNGAATAEVERGGRHRREDATVALRSAPSNRDRATETGGSPGDAEPTAHSNEMITTQATRPGPRGSHDDAIRRRLDDEPRFDPHVHRPVGFAQPSIIDPADHTPATTVRTGAGSVAPTREPPAATARIAGQPSGALGELVRNWSTASTPQVLATNRVDERLRPAIGTADADDRLGRPTRTSARMPRSASEAPPLERSTASISTSATPESMIDDLVERALDRIVQRDADRHVIEWGRS